MDFILTKSGTKIQFLTFSSKSIERLFSEADKEAAASDLIPGRLLQKNYN